MSNSKNGFKKFLCSGTGKAILIILGYVFILVCLALGIHIMSSNPNENFFIFLIVTELIFAIFGWRALNKITPRIFLILPLIGWVIYFLVKFLLSMLIGAFVAPFVIAKMVTNLVQKSLTAQMKHEESLESVDISTQPAPKNSPTPAEASSAQQSVSTTLPVKEQINQIQLLKEYKNLLDSGIISQEEFDEKKESLLNTPTSKSFTDTSVSFGESAPQNNTVVDDNSEATSQTKKKKKKHVFLKLLIYVFLVLWICVMALLIPNVRFWIAENLVDTPVNQVSYFLFDTLSNYEESGVYQAKIRYLDVLSLLYDDKIEEARSQMNESIGDSNDWCSVKIVKTADIDGQSIQDYAWSEHYKSGHTYVYEKNISYVYDKNNNPLMSYSWNCIRFKRNPSDIFSGYDTYGTKVFIEYVYDSDGNCIELIIISHTNVH